MSDVDYTITNLELRESNPDGSEGAGLAHKSEGLFLLHVKELASDGEPRGCVTVLHDAGDHGGRYLKLARLLAAEGWAVALPDLRGHGESEGERGHSWGIKEVERDIGSVQDHLAYRLPEAPKVLVGQGLGGMYALSYALRQPGQVAALVLAAPLLEPRFELPEAAGGLMKLFKKVGPTSPGRVGYSAEQLTRDAGERSAWSSDARVHDVVTKRAGESILEAAEECRRRAAELQIPTLLIVGDSDPIAGAPTLPGDAVERREVAGGMHHVLHDEGAGERYAEIAAWLRTHVA